MKRQVSLLRFLCLIIVGIALASCATPPPPPPPEPTAEDHFRSGMSYLNDGYYDAAISEFKAAISMNPAYKEAHYYLGQAYEKKGMDAQSEQAYKDAIRIDPRYIQAHEALGLLLYRLNRFPEAKAELEMAVNLNSVLPEIYTKLGEIYLTEKCCLKARNMFKKALEINSEFYPAKDGLKRAQRLCGRPPYHRPVKKLKKFQGGGKALSPENF
ncbi:MAG: tetratricopeptide repeat protein [Deltaproteobacteria bacterium]|nr:tetratricopeptide repeat protein [Deltaproteobacteria bacterium]MBW2067333.1 tetratricopeptide repeat protein [Deltaproteobacteria bacterium]